ANWHVSLWSAPAERSGDGALDWPSQINFIEIQSAVAAALCRRTPYLFLNSEPVNQRRDDRLGKAPRDAHHGRILFIKKVARIVGEFKLATKNKILVVVKHAVIVLVAHGHRGRDRHFKNPSAPFVIQQNASETEILDHAVNHRIGPFAFALHAQAVS